MTILVRAGAGGNGCESYFRRADRKRIPNGGDGGAGGDVIVRADANTGGLGFLTSHAVCDAGSGGAGMTNKRHGPRGKDRLIKAPCGTTLYNKADNLLIRDLVVSGEEVTVLKGGRGGYGNHSGRPATRGEPGKSLELLLSYKLITDIVMIGLPNSGKTSLLKALTGAGVSSAEYPFATKQPLLGTYESDFAKLRLCELPSLYEASSAGRGLGTHFLKHVERARLIFLVLDPETQFADDLKAGYDILLQNLRDFNVVFIEKPRFIVINKRDLNGDDGQVAALLPGERVFQVSAKTRRGLSQLMQAAEAHLGQANETAN